MIDVKNMIDRTITSGINTGYFRQDIKNLLTKEVRDEIKGRVNIMSHGGVPEKYIAPIISAFIRGFQHGLDKQK